MSKHDLKHSCHLFWLIAIAVAAPAQAQTPAVGVTVFNGSYLFSATTEGGLLSFRVALDAASGNPVVVSYLTRGGTATPGVDFEPVTGAITFAPGEIDRVIGVSTIGDTAVEPDETVVFELTGATGATIARPIAVGIVLNDEQPRLTVVMANKFRDCVMEPPAGSVVGIAVEIAILDSSPEMVVSYSTQDGSAIASRDYVAVSGVVTIPAGLGIRTQHIQVPLLGDAIPTGPRSFLVNASSGAATNVGTVTIVDNKTTDHTRCSGRSDILLQAADGVLELWPMEGRYAFLFRQTLYEKATREWAVAALADFEGDGLHDVLWRNANTGETYYWGNFRRGWSGHTGDGVFKFTSAQADLSWSVVGTSDYDGDTRSDVLWRQPSTGAMAVWYMAGPTVLGTYVFGGPGPAWRAVRVDDFNGDGRGDVLWRETGTGATYLWLMNGTQVIGGTGYTSGQADARWAIETTGDFDGDGRADILWRNAGGPDTGALFVWLMDGTSIKGATYLDPISIDWQVQGLGDYNGDGKSDILWRNVNPGAVDAGRFYIWMMNGPAVIAGTGYTSPQADLSWRVEAPRK